MLIGAIIGDIAGSRFEFKNTFREDFSLFAPECSYTDDTICTLAIADAILKGKNYGDSLKYWCRKYPNPMGHYGGSFNRWVHSISPTPYYSYGNGAAMRVSPVAWASNKQPAIIRHALLSAEVTHNHPEGLIGAMVTALLIYYHRAVPHDCYHHNRVNAVCEDLIIQYYGSDYKAHLPRIGEFDETCQGCVPLAWHIIKQSWSFEDAIRKAVAYGGDSDTLAAIVGSIAEPRFGVPEEMEKEALTFLPADLLNVYNEFNKKYGG